MPHPVWIVVANGSRARLLRRDRPGAPLFEVMDWAHPETRQHMGLQKGEHRTSGTRDRAGLASRQEAKNQERAQFAREIGQWLHNAAQAQGIGDLAVFASNPFLGELTSHCNGLLGQQLSASHALDLTSLPLLALDQRLQQDYRL